MSSRAYRKYQCNYHTCQVLCWILYNVLHSTSHSCPGAPFPTSESFTVGQTAILLGSSAPCELFNMLGLYLTSVGLFLPSPSDKHICSPNPKCCQVSPRYGTFPKTAWRRSLGDNMQSGVTILDPSASFPHQHWLQRSQGWNKPTRHGSVTHKVGGAIHSRQEIL